MCIIVEIEVWMIITILVIKAITAGCYQQCSYKEQEIKQSLHTDHSLFGSLYTAFLTLLKAKVANISVIKVSTLSSQRSSKVPLYV